MSSSDSDSSSSGSVPPASGSSRVNPFAHRPGGARRAEGVYGPRRHRRAIATVAGVLCGLVVLTLILI